MSDTIQINHLESSEIKRRISNIHKDIWIDCPQARKAIDTTLNIINVPKRTTAPCMLVCGNGGSGKTTIVNQLMKMNRGLGSPFVFLSLAENPSNLKFKHLVLEAIGLPIGLATGRNNLPNEVANYILSLQIKAIIIDEFHDCLLVSKNEQLKILSLLKWLSGTPCNLSVIGFGTKSARNALQYDVQLARRYHIQELVPWGLNDEFRNFLATLEHKVGLKKASNLHQEKMLRLIHHHSTGTMDNVVRIIKAAAIYAITTGEEQITKELIEKAASEPWGYS
ncbi:TniB family NTP-binding protein [Pseudomonas sp. O230]|uniref:TniB family NTP-binding protein n=1 Tax=Pseudomonas sp. O230 TaxID=3159450 RepID=UPI00387B780E